jgi:hypothetical protein
MSLCFVDPIEALLVISASLTREGRSQLYHEALTTWVDTIPDESLEAYYGNAIQELDEHDLAMLASWHGAYHAGPAVPNVEFLAGAFPALGDNRRAAVKIVVGFFADDLPEAETEAGLKETVVELSKDSMIVLLKEAVDIYIWDRLGTEN